MQRLRAGDREAADHLFSVPYPELRRVAATKEMKVFGGFVYGGIAQRLQVAMAVFRRLHSL